MPTSNTQLVKVTMCLPRAVKIVSAWHLCSASVHLESSLRLPAKACAYHAVDRDIPATTACILRAAGIETVYYFLSRSGLEIEQQTVFFPLLNAEWPP